MNLGLPSRLVKAMEEVKRKRLHFFTLDKVWLYTASSSEFFNAAVEDRLALLQAQYGFNPPEHEDWVHPAATYFLSEGWQPEEVPGSIHPLNAIILKNPVSFVPTFEEIFELAEYAHVVALSATDKTRKVPTAEDLHDRYVERVCLQLQCYESLLQSWREIGMPREQRDCLPHQSFAKVRKILVAQRSNVNDVKKNYENLCKSDFPKFVLDRYLALLCREQKILDELTEILRFSK